MNSIIELFQENKKIKDYIANIKEKISPISILGLSSVGKEILIQATNALAGKKICIITYNEMQAKRMQKDLEYFNNKIVYFPKKEVVTYDYVAASRELLYERIDALNKIIEKKPNIIITTIESVMQPITSKKDLYKNSIEFKVGQSYNLETIKQQLVDLGYERYDLLEGRGGFSLRGGILDISLDNKQGIRIEFWGDEVDSIRKFDIMTQRSEENIENIKINPAHEEIGEDSSNFIEFLSKEYLIALDEPSKIVARAQNIIKDNDIVIQNLLEKGKIVPSVIENMFNYEQIENYITKHQILNLEQQDIGISRQNTYNFTMREVNYTKAELDDVIEFAKESINKKYVVILGGTEETARKLSLLLLEKEIPHIYEEHLKKPIDKTKVTVTTGSIEEGIEWYDLDLIVIAGKELFVGKAKRKKKLSSAFKQGEAVVFSDLKVGDYIVHKTNGIGQFMGVNTITTDNITKDYIKIRYKDDGMLYIPTSSLDNVRKYVGTGEAVPRLNKLGSKEWENTKAKVKNNLREVARNLIELYAKRQKIKGFGFSKDAPWQIEFEDKFPYTETDDQLRCIEEVKQDMEKEKPMDRLLCGDVGYGKTEVAIRAAFKACMDGKQVAYLAPTTVLSNQQYETFKQRMQGYPIKVEVLNRFRTKKQQDEIIKKVKLGEVDILLGTHRILSKDVDFKDLGLLIIDEEHRFGVKHKEKIKELKTSVDVLTMTATPIPRTLHMSIVGVRDMSVIYEPPGNRRPVQTYVLEYDQEIIKEAITKELERGGQVFYLFNNVEKIALKAEQINDLIPEARVSFAHGKMSGNDIEEIMQDFIDQKSNVLVCTTILESGIDIPNANTIIVENADRLGLAQLYQIRGRVGRSDRQAYAYVTYKRDKLLSEIADKRLKAIKEFTEFGSGFRIAMRDLEIRGAGSLVGEIQHGHMEQVGYDTYCKLLDEVIRELQGNKIEEEEEIQIDLKISSYIPDVFIENSSQKIEVYQNIALCRTEEDIRNVIDEIIDRFGNMPNELENLIEIARIKQLCMKKGINKLVQKREKIVFYLNTEKFNMENIGEIINKYKNKIQFSPASTPYITYKLDLISDKNIVKEIKEFLAI